MKDARVISILEKSIEKGVRQAHIYHLNNKAYFIYIDFMHNDRPIVNCLVGDNKRHWLVAKESDSYKKEEVDFWKTMSRTISNYELKVLEIEKNINKYIKAMDNNKAIKTTKLFALNQKLIEYEISLKSIERVLERIIIDKDEHIYSIEDYDKYTNVMLDIEVLVQKCEMDKDTINSLITFYQNDISYKLNTTMNKLTIITLVIAIPTFIASVYGMNVRLPFQTTPNVFYYLVLVSVIFVSLTIYLFTKRDK